MAFKSQAALLRHSNPRVAKQQSRMGRPSIQYVPHGLLPTQTAYLQRAVGNQAVGRALVSVKAGMIARQADLNAQSQQPKSDPGASAQEIYTVKDPKAMLRTPPPELKATGQVIPVGEQIAVLETAKLNKAQYVLAQQHLRGEVAGPPRVWGWTAIANLTRGATDILETVKTYDEYIKDASTQYGIAVEQIRAIIATESRGRATATNQSAFGLMQLTKKTWGDTQKHFQELKQYDFANYWSDPRINILFGTATLKQKMGMIGVDKSSPNFATAAIVAYNAGEGTLKQAIKLARANGSKNPEADCLKAEYMKPAIRATQIYTFYVTGRGYRRNPHMTNVKGKIGVKAGSTMAQAIDAAIDLKYAEVSRYPTKVQGYLDLQKRNTQTWQSCVMPGKREHLDPGFLAKLDKICGRMKAASYATKIAWGRRTLPQQIEIYARGRTFAQFKAGLLLEAQQGHITQAEAQQWINYYDPHVGKNPMPTGFTAPVTWTTRSAHLTGKAADVVEPKQGWQAPPAFWQALAQAAQAEGLQIGPPASDLAHVQEPNPW